MTETKAVADLSAVEPARQLLHEKLSEYMASYQLASTGQLSKHLATEYDPAIEIGRSALDAYLRVTEASLPTDEKLRMLRQFLDISDKEVNQIKTAHKQVLSARALKGSSAARSGDSSSPLGEDEAIRLGKETLRRCVLDFLAAKRISRFQLAKLTNVPKSNLGCYVAEKTDDISLPTRKSFNKLKKVVDTINTEAERVIRKAMKANTSRSARTSATARAERQKSETVPFSPDDSSVLERLVRLEQRVFGADSLSVAMSGSDNGRYDGSGGVRWQLRADNTTLLDGLSVSDQEVAVTKQLLITLSQHFAVYAQMKDRAAAEQIVAELKEQLVELYTNVVATEAHSLHELIALLEEQRSVLQQ